MAQQATGNIHEDLPEKEGAQGELLPCLIAPYCWTPRALDEIVEQCDVVQ